MNRTSRLSVTVATLALSGGPLLLAVPAAADTAGRTKAGIEYAERQASAGDRASKAQIEQQEREQALTGGGQEKAPTSGSTSGSTSGGAGGSDASAWQLALAAALGAGLTGGVVVASRQVSQHRHAVAQ
jgi:hypothetical protein